MAKTLVIAEKPSVGRDLAGAPEGPFQRRKLDDIKPKRGKKKAAEEPSNEEVVEAAKSKTKAKTTREEAVFLESDDYVITWAVGHLVQLADPEEYDEKFKKWRMADLPIVPGGLQARPARREVEEAAEADPQADEARGRRPRSSTPATPGARAS